MDIEPVTGKGPTEPGGAGRMANEAGRRGTPNVAAPTDAGAGRSGPGRKQPRGPSGTRAVLQRLVRDELADLLLASACVGCARPGRRLCGECAVPLTAAPWLARPSPAPEGLPPTWSVAAYSGVVRSALVAHKDRGVRGVIGPLAEALGGTLVPALRAAAGSQGDAGGMPRALLVVPVPTTRAAVRARADDPLARLGRRAVGVAARHLRDEGDDTIRPRWAPALRAVRCTNDQAGLGAIERRANLAGAFAVRPGRQAWLAGRPVVVVDDVLTTGATLAEAARAVGTVDGTPVAAAVVAATRRRQ